MLLKNKSFLVKIVPDEPTPTPAEANPNTTESRVIETVKEAAKAFVVLYAATKAIDTTSKITVHIAKTKIK